jgi:HNH endonuclease
MRRAAKNSGSEILKQKLNYIPSDSANNKKIADILFAEQKMFCAYTDEYISRTDAKDVEHFNPTLKNTNQDNYNNWFIVKHQWNKEKSYKWGNFQPVLHPTATDFEERVEYFMGDYFAKSKQDIEAVNLVSLLKLDDTHLAEKRKKYIKRRREHIELSKMDATSYFKELISDEPFHVHYLRAIKEEFGIDIWGMIN